MIKESAVQCGLLVRILTIPQGHRFCCGYFQYLGETGNRIQIRLHLLALFEVSCNRRIISCGAGKNFLSKFTSQLIMYWSFLFQSMQDPFIIVRIANNGYIPMVFSRASEHGWTPDIDLFDRFFQRDPVTGNGFFKRIKIHHHQIDHFNPMFLRSRQMIRISTEAK